MREILHPGRSQAQFRSHAILGQQITGNSSRSLVLGMPIIFLAAVWRLVIFRFDKDLNGFDIILSQLKPAVFWNSFAKGGNRELPLFCKGKAGTCMTWLAIPRSAEERRCHMLCSPSKSWHEEPTLLFQMLPSSISKMVFATDFVAL